MRLFVNYAAQDIEAVEELAEALIATGHEAWYKHYLTPQSDWQSLLVSDLAQCDGMVYALSEASVHSPWCCWTYTKAVEMEIPIISVLVETPVIIPFELRGRPILDFSAGVSPLLLARLHHDLPDMLFIVPPEIIEPISPPAEAPPRPGMVREQLVTTIDTTATDSSRARRRMVDSVRQRLRFGRHVLLYIVVLPIIWAALMISLRLTSDESTLQLIVDSLFLTGAVATAWGFFGLFFHWLLVRSLQEKEVHETRLQRSGVVRRKDGEKWPGG